MSISSDRARRWSDVLIDPVMRAEAARDTTIVHTLGREAITAAYDETRRIATGALAGCAAVAAVLEYEEIRKAYLQHMPPTRNDLAVLWLSDFLQAEPIKRLNNSHAVVMTPSVGERKYRAISESYAKGAWGRMAREGLVEAAVKALGPDAHVQMVEYDWTDGFSQMLVELLDTGDHVISINGHPV